jgi:hypothetical protein
LTEDADCVVRRERANLENLAAALRELHARLRVARMSDEEAKTLPIQVDGVMLEATGNSTWTTDAGPFDVLSELKDFKGRSVPYEELMARSIIVRGDGFTVHVATGHPNRSVNLLSDQIRNAWSVHGFDGHRLAVSTRSL